MTEKNKEVKKKPQLWQLLLKWSARVLGVIAGLTLLFVLLLQFSAVQTYLSSRVTSYISEKTGTETTAKKLKINPFKGILLKEFVILDNKKDTIADIQTLSISLYKNIFSIFSNNLDLSFIGAQHLHLNITTREGEQLSNFERFVRDLSGKRNESNASNQSFLLDVKRIDLSDILVEIRDENKGVEKKISLGSGVVYIKFMDLECLAFDIDKLVLENPSYTVDIFKEESTFLNRKIQSENSEEINDETDPLSLKLKELVVKNGYFRKANRLLLPEPAKSGFLDYDNFFYENINILLTDLNFNGIDDLDVQLNHLSARDNTGFTINNFKADTISIKPEFIELKSYEIKMGNSHIKDNLKFSFINFSAFNDFGNEVMINADLENSLIQLNDLAHFVKSIGESNFVKNNGDEIIKIAGSYTGRANNISGRDVDITLGDKLEMAGNFNTRDLLDKDNALLNIKMDKFNTSVWKLKTILPTLSLPDNFYKLGNVNFTGRFDGYLEDFVAYGKLRSSVGTAELDMRLDVTDGAKKARYSGILNLTKFNLGKWSGNSDFGLVDFSSKVSKGRGLDLETVNADLETTIKSLVFKDYHYKNIELDGTINKNVFNGQLTSDDENFDLVFDGKIELAGGMAELNFNSTVNNIDLQALNITDKTARFKGRLDIDVPQAKSVNDFLGILKLDDIEVQYKDSLYTMNRLTLRSTDALGLNGEIIDLFQLDSDIGTVELKGHYKLTEVVHVLKKVLYNNYVYFEKVWKPEVAKYPDEMKFDFNINFANSKNLLSLIGLNDSYFNGVELKGRLDSKRNELLIASEVKYLEIKNQNFKKIEIHANSTTKAGDYIIHIDSTYAIGKKFNPIDVRTTFVKDTMNFEFATERLIDTLENLDIRGRLIPDPLGYKLSLAENLLVLLGSEWIIDKRNSIVFGDKYFSFEDAIISDGYRKIQISDINNHRGLRLLLQNFNMDIINPIIEYDKMKFAGNANISAQLDDYFEKDKTWSVYLDAPDFTINKDPYGSFHAEAEKAKGDDMTVSVNIGDFIGVVGVYDTKNKYLNSKIKLQELPLRLVEYLIKDGVKNTKGKIDADITLTGPTNDLTLYGIGYVNGGQTTIIYTGATYFFDHQKLTLTNTEISLDGDTITDINGNAGTVYGGLYHDMFRRFGVDAVLVGNHVVALNTTKEDNPDYYGYGIGQVRAEFTGLLDFIDMRITAVTGPGTKLYIPISSSESSIDESFIKFVKRDTSGIKVPQKDIANEGIDLEMSITVTPDAELSLIFDEAKGDIIKGRGQGNLKMAITRLDDFEVFGDYEIETGQYLFTAPLIPVAKPFIVETGSKIIWTGDPIDATLDITAKYRTRTAVEPFISEYLVGLDDQISLARQNTEVDVELILGGTLFRPDIRFNLDFPNLTGDIANFASNKIKLLEGNDQELNGQVLGLIVFNTFIQSNRVSDMFGATGFQSAGMSTLSEFLSSQLSMYITSIINSVVGEDGFISGVDFGVNVRNNNFGLVSNDLTPDEIAVRNTIVFKNDRLSLDIGGNYVFQFQGIEINQVLPDFALEFRLTEDRKLKIRLYGKYDIDITTTGLREKYGLGMAYRTEFGSMTHFENTIKTVVRDSVSPEN